MSIKRIDQQGVSLVEMMIAVLILSAMASSVIMARSFMAKQTVRSTDKAYATQKAIQMFEELKALVNGNEQLGVAVLDDYSDGTQVNTVLTTDKFVDVPPPGTKKPGDPLSGNRQTNGNWRYLRQVDVKKVANDPYARQVVIKVYRYASDFNPGAKGELLATVGGMLRTIANLFSPTQVLDIYVISINNTQAWWAVLPALSSSMGGVLQDIQGRNPGLELRTHYITRAAYGRDPEYLPYINNTVGTQGVTFPWIYLYPGLAPEEGGANGCGCNSAYFDASSGGIQQCGNFNVDGNILLTSASQFSACPSYTVADQFNHGMRYPDELAKYKAVTAAAAASNSPIPEISYRMLLEGMNSSPQSFTNAILMNLHGELLPLPPMRNYSDAAKSPTANPNVRLVTHPELLYYPTAGTADVKLRVYAYYDGLTDPTALNTVYPDPQTLAYASIFLPDINLAPAAVTAVAIRGSSTVNYATSNLTSGAAAVNGMSLTVTNPVSGGVTGTLINLVNTPLRHPLKAGAGGVSTANRLYNLEYVPSSPENTTAVANITGYTFTAQSLTDTSDSHVKNTARWIITLPAVAAGEHAVETRIGNAVTSSAVIPNLSKTYFWIGNNYPPPTTERYQFTGDPRHCPYLDVKTGGPAVAGAGTTIQSHGYNWYFKNLNGTTDGYTGFDRGGNIAGWGPDDAEVDIPRYMQMVREGLLKTTSIWTTTNGWSFYYFGIGGEFGFDHAPFSNSLTMRLQPWSSTNSGTTLTTVSEIINNANTNRPRVIAGTGSAGTANQWFAKAWLGEMYPDSCYSIWQTAGNLPCLDNGNAFAAGATMKFYRERYGNITSSGTTTGFGRNVAHRNQGSGAPCFFNGTISGGTGTFEHLSGNWNGNVMSLGTTCYSIFQYPMPPLVDADRPWDLAGGNPPGSVDGWSTNPYDTTRTSLSIPAVGGVSRIYYDNTGNVGYNTAGVVRMVNTAGTSQIAYVTETGTSPSQDVGTAELAKTTLLFALRTFLDGGQMAATLASGHITQLPLVKIYPVQGSPVTINPVPQYSNPSAITVMVGGPVLDPSGNTPIANVWYRYPGVTSNVANYYTAEYPGYNTGVTGTLTNSTYAEAVDLLYNLKYSPDAGKSWRAIQTGATVLQGVLDAANAITINAPVTGTYQYTWDVSNPITYPQGGYWITVEAYRLGLPLHYSYHTLELTINR